MTQRILEPGQIETLASRSIPRVRLPDRTRVFADRAARLRTLARNHALGGYLALVARLCDAQQTALARHAPAAPTDAAIERAETHGMPPLPASGPRDAAWRRRIPMCGFHLDVTLRVAMMQRSGAKW